MSVHHIVDEKYETDLVEIVPSDHELSAVAGKDAVDVVAASMLAPVGGIVMTEDEYKIVSWKSKFNLVGCCARNELKDALA